ncbi:hypothetical protein [Sulfurimonas sp.]|uniref:hypothetical protein n=1 Tax=Sulfurimonas sp. TaxID=2022749 RepID=UPI0035651EEB
MSKEDKKDIFADYKPEVVEYDPEVDGGEVYKERDEHLDHKEDALEKIRKAKAKAKGNQTTFRQNIRTENEK